MVKKWTMCRSLWQCITNETKLPLIVVCCCFRCCCCCSCTRCCCCCCRCSATYKQETQTFFSSQKEEKPKFLPLSFLEPIVVGSTKKLDFLKCLFDYRLPFPFQFISLEFCSKWYFESFIALLVFHALEWFFRCLPRSHILSEMMPQQWVKTGPKFNT